MRTLPAARRLSPRVRRLLDEHGIRARTVAGSGTGGRVTPRDVLDAAGVPRRTGRPLASPRARRLLRDADIALDAVVRTNEGHRLRAADAGRIVRDLADGVDGADRTGPTAGAGTGWARSTSSDVEVDVSLLLAGVAAVERDLRTHDGVALPPEVALAAAAAAVLVRRPDLAIATGLPRAEDRRTYPPVHLGFPRPGAGGPEVAVVPEAQYLTVAGLARRARTAPASGDGAGATPIPTLVAASDATSPAGLVGGTAIGLLTLGSRSRRHHTVVDHRGSEVVVTRTHARVRLHHDDRTTTAAATAFLEELAATIGDWSIPVGP